VFNTQHHSLINPDMGKPSFDGRLAMLGSDMRNLKLNTSDVTATPFIRIERQYRESSQFPCLERDGSRGWLGTAAVGISALQVAVSLITPSGIERDNMLP
jgi:hypothetical protein